MIELIIGYDIADENSIDHSAVSMMCGSCRTVISVHTYEDKQIVFERPDKCPCCGVVFKFVFEVGRV